MKSNDRLENILIDVVNDHVENNNEVFYQRVMLCMVRLSRLFIERACVLVTDAASISEEFWKNFIPNDNYPMLTIDAEYSRLSKFIDAGADGGQDLYARAVRLMNRGFDRKSLDYNVDIFPLFVEYSVKLGCYREDIAEIIEECLDSKRAS